MEPTIGEIRMFAGNFAPRSWALCEGQLLPISQNQAMFSILGTTYGGDGRTSFGLPDLRGRMAISSGIGPGLSNIALGQRSGAPSLSISVANLPAHNHTLNAGNVAGTNSSPVSGSPALAQVRVERGAAAIDVNAFGVTSNDILGSGAVGNTGGNIPVALQNPYLAVNFIICLFGVFPSRS
jgi:microcystin-dependent protein